MLSLACNFLLIDEVSTTCVVSQPDFSHIFHSMRHGQAWPCRQQLDAQCIRFQCATTLDCPSTIIQGVLVCRCANCISTIWVRGRLVRDCTELHHAIPRRQLSLRPMLLILMVCNALLQCTESPSIKHQGTNWYSTPTLIAAAQLPKHTTSAFRIRSRSQP